MLPADDLPNNAGTNSKDTLHALVDAAFPVIYRRPTLARPNIAKKQYDDFYKRPSHPHNKVLELLGGSILALSTSTMLYDRCPDASRSFITTCQSALVGNRILAFIGDTSQAASPQTTSFYDAVTKHKTVVAPASFEIGQVKPTADIVRMSVGALFEWDGLEACYEYVQDSLSVPAMEVVKAHARREAGWGVPFNATGMVKKRELQIFDVRNFQQKFKDYVQSRIRQELNLEDTPGDSRRPTRLPANKPADEIARPMSSRPSTFSKTPAPTYWRASIKGALGSIASSQVDENESWRPKQVKRPAISDCAGDSQGRYVPPAKRIRFRNHN